jgi:hypothetical protein
MIETHYFTLFGFAMLLMTIIKLKQKITELESDLRDYADSWNCAVKGGSTVIQDLKDVIQNLKSENKELRRVIDKLRIEGGFKDRKIQDVNSNLSFIKNLSEIFSGKSL